MILIMKIKRYEKIGRSLGWNKNEIKAIDGGKENDHGKDCLEIKFNSDDNLPLNKPLKFHAIIIIKICFLKKVVNSIYKFFQTTFCMSYNDVTVPKN